MKIDLEKFKAKKLAQQAKEAEKRAEQLSRKRAGLDLNMEPYETEADLYIRKFMKRAKINTTTDCWEWQGELKKNGYGVIYYKGKRWRAHRLSFLLFSGELPPSLFICHKCDNPKCINPAHLFAGTHLDNMRDCAAKGRRREQKARNSMP